MLRVESIAPMPPSLKPPSPSQSLTSLRDVLAYNVRACRVVIGLSQEQLGFSANLDRTFISQVERARINVSIDNIEKLATALGVSASALLERPASTRR
ncbi:helix-turn-helix family protein (plasmid) [Paraburkholderia fungorum]|uniref:Helix-turn-helix family protein n=3 Tax=Paraburkholderia fungorum TaxID=134537 RepID=A0AAW3V5Q2_9BURK|nr:helix-turn-helix transcriptional regulator [Paraburkholderia fungorum]AJZ56239.1 helix-turn-helix family protein [Paraburkholderia fungorum]MBB4516346.1 transcriptional regulator with XRE-family HTH domain [Paraburkholderia fungorum]MBB6205182.1 transcriptional regulator with XRE-family HTH domain [Paraburkholderia fungorum]PRZ52347.1 helix-turn-helix protein [Paraburkholderia fungorum]USU21790.1 helix-turn-helix domain-containing protein [Paraburkholderia fungorum]